MKENFIKAVQGLVNKFSTRYITLYDSGTIRKNYGSQTNIKHIIFEKINNIVKYQYFCNKCVLSDFLNNLKLE